MFAKALENTSKESDASQSIAILKLDNSLVRQPRGAVILS